MRTLDPYVVSPKEMQELISLHTFLDSSGLDESLIELLRLHVSLLNGCARGVHRHSGRLTKLGETTARLVELPAWRSASLFTERERAALEWSEAVTLVSGSHIPDNIHVAIRQWFTDVEIVKLTMIIAATTGVESRGDELPAITCRARMSWRLPAGSCAGRRVALRP